MYSFVKSINMLIFVLFSVFYLYQIFYTLVSLVFKSREFPAGKLHKYAVLIAARNESPVIGKLIESIKKQNYPSELVDIYVIADNCTDDTADVAERAGARVFRRFDDELIGKGYALNYAFSGIRETHGIKHYDGYFVFDADNLLDENFISEMNKVFAAGYRVVTSYRNSKNYDTNWISAGSSLWFLREAKYLNNARMILGTSCMISGTGFLVHSDIIESNSGWNYYLLTEDIEFSIDNVIKGEVIGYCPNAKLYDEQPYFFEQSWNQRLRWAKGFYQVFMKYGMKLFKTMFKRRSFSCYDIFMTVTPAMFISLLGVFINTVFLVIGFLNVDILPHLVVHTISAIITSIINFYIVLFFFGLITTVTEWHEINAKPYKKILYVFSFPVFIFTYVPISVVALFRRIQWKPITHSIVKSIEEFQR